MSYNEERRRGDREEMERKRQEESRQENQIPLAEMSREEIARIRSLQYISQAPDRVSYVQRQQEVAKELGMTIRNVQRLMRTWRQGGLAGIVRRGRSDRGERRVDEQWQRYILRTYREGNRGGKRMNRSQVAVRVAARAIDMGIEEYPSRATVYRILQPEIDKQRKKQQKRSLGWQGEKLTLHTREGLELEIEYSNQVWQCDHSKLDILVVDRAGEILGRPWLTTIVDTYSRCLMGIYLGMEVPSSQIVCLALRHAILPKQYSWAYELTQTWGTYGVPQYLYTDGGKEFSSLHLETVAGELGFVCCKRCYPAEGGIVERPFGTFNSELLSTLPGYTANNVKKRPKQAEANASLTLEQLEKLLVRYIVERYNQSLDARTGEQTRLGRWEAGRMAQLPLIEERKLDICLMRRERRRVYRGGYIKLANLTYRGEHLEGYAGEWVVIRYNPRDITSIWLYREKGSAEQFLTRAHAIGLETENLAIVEAQAMSRRLRAAGRAVSNQSVLDEVRWRDLNAA
jgi:putative transposase